jgi:hypothetical protein
MPIEKKDARLTSSVPARYETVVTRAAKRDGKTVSEYLFDMLTPVVEREEEYVLSIAKELNLVNVNDISQGYTINQNKKAMYSAMKRPDLRIVASN